jgi:hypothetical protein
VEAVKPNSKYEKRRALRRFEKLRWPRSMSLEVVELPSLTPSNKGIATTYPHKIKPNNLHMSQPSWFIGDAWNERGHSYYHPKVKGEYMDRGPQSRCKLCGEVGHQTILCHYWFFNFGW